MKIRNGFVSNSSSSSFIIAYDPTTKVKECFTDDVLGVIGCEISSTYDEFEKLQNGSIIDCFEDDKKEFLEKFFKDHPNHKLAYWTGDYSCQGRDEIIEDMFEDTIQIYYYCSDGETVWHHEEEDNEE